MTYKILIVPLFTSRRVRLAFCLDMLLFPYFGSLFICIFWFMVSRVSGFRLLLMIGFLVNHRVNLHLLLVRRVMNFGSPYWRRHMQSCMALTKH